MFGLNSIIIVIVTVSVPKNMLLYNHFVNHQIYYYVIQVFFCLVCAFSNLKGIDFESIGNLYNYSFV